VPNLNLDMLLTIAGLVLMVIGVAVFLLGKSRVAAGDERSNIFEAFGIKLDVSNPSILLIMFGVVLMLAPRFVPLGDVALPEASDDTVSVAPAKPPAAMVAPASPEAATAPAEAKSEPSSARVAEPPALPLQSPPPPVVQQVAVPDEAAAAAQREKLAALEAQRESIAKEQAALAAERARLAALAAKPAAPAPKIAPPEALEAAAAPRLAVFTEALEYEQETAETYRAKLHSEMRTVIGDVLADGVDLQPDNGRFRPMPPINALIGLCKRTQAQHLLLADLAPVTVFNFGVESANWPEMRYAAVDCSSGRATRSDIMRMEPIRGDQYPFQQSIARTAREFIRDNRHLLQ
jgi:hypothetical protein